MSIDTDDRGKASKDSPCAIASHVRVDGNMARAQMYEGMVGLITVRRSRSQSQYISGTAPTAWSR